MGRTKQFETRNYYNLVGGELQFSPVVIQVKNPADIRQVVATVPMGGADRTSAAIDAADKAFNSEWSDMKNSREREKVMRSAIAKIENDKQELAKLYTMSQGKPLAEAVSEIDSFLNTMDYFAGFGGKVLSHGTDVKMGKDLLHVEDRPYPIGVIGAITPWNFEVSLLGWKTAPALIAGNTMVVKPASTTPLITTEIMRRISKSAQERGFDPGVVNVVTGNSSIIGDVLTSHKKIRKVTFTGSTEVGLKVYEQAAKYSKYVTLEMGGSDATIVCDDAEMETAASDIVFKGRFRNAGQSCTSVKRLFVFENIFDEFVGLLKKNASMIRVGNGLDPETTMGPVHNEQQLVDIAELVEDSKNRGATGVMGGKEPEGKQYANGYFYEPTILTDIPEGAKIWSKECFGPALPIQKVKDLDEAINRANNTQYGLGTGIWTTDYRKLRIFEDRIEAGNIWENSPPLSVPETSFGGVKDSGIGRELGLDGLKENLEYRSIRRLLRNM